MHDLLCRMIIHNEIQNCKNQPSSHSTSVHNNFCWERTSYVCLDSILEFELCVTLQKGFTSLINQTKSEVSTRLVFAQTHDHTLFSSLVEISLPRSEP